MSLHRGVYMLQVVDWMSKILVHGATLVLVG